MPSPDPADLAGIRDAGGLDLLEGPALALAYLAFNTTEAPFDTPAARRAVARAIDRQAIVAEVFGGAATAVDGILPAPMSGRNEAAADFDGAAAKQAVAAAGVAGARLRLWVSPGGPRPTIPIRRRWPEAIRSQLGAAGIEAKIETPPADEFVVATLDPDREGAVLHGWVSDNGDPDNLLAPLLGCDAVGIANRTGWCNAALRCPPRRGAGDHRPGGAGRLYAEAAAGIVADEAPLVPIAAPLVTVATTDAVTGIVADPFGRHNFEAVDIVEGE